MSAQDALDSGDISSTQYAQKMQRLMKNLRDIGVEDHLDLPLISVIGGQSAGKSSLVEAVSGVRVPRDGGTCTRCPMECMMRRTAGAWSCQISLRFDQESPGGNPRKVVFGPLLSDKADVELSLRRAQAAILNPNVPHEHFMFKTVEELQYYTSEGAFAAGSLRFSKNTVCVEISDPGSADLTFVDLPGLISNDSSENVQLVEDIAKWKIRGDRCLILVTIPMNDDMQNQKAVRLALEADPTKIRTIGILTKPDGVTEGATSARDKWKDVIEGRADKLRHGYYCVRLPDDAERAQKLSRSATQELASKFFSTTSPWNAIDDQTRFGIPALVRDLSKQLTAIIARSLPTLRIEVQSKIKECKKQLAELPQPMENDPSAELISMITEFCQGLRMTVNGNGQAKSFIQRNLASYAVFKEKIWATAPDFRPFEKASEYNRPTYDRSDSEGITKEWAPEVKAKDLYDVRRVIKGSIAWELPHNVPFSAKAQLIHEFTSLWEAPAVECYEEVNERLTELLEMNCGKTFGRFPRLEEHISMLIAEQLQILRDQAHLAVTTVLGLEKTPSFTQNTHYLESAREKWLSRYKDTRRNASRFKKPRDVVPLSPQPMSPYGTRPNSPRAKRGAVSPYSTRPNSPEAPPADYFTSNGYASTPHETALHALAAIGYHGLSTKDLARLCPPDAFEDELIVMADVRAFFQVAFKRVIDNLPLTIEHSLNQPVADNLEQLLWHKLDFGSSDASQRLAELFAEDPLIAATRVRLEAELNKLEQAQQELRNFGVV